MAVAYFGQYPVVVVPFDRDREWVLACFDPQWPVLKTQWPDLTSSTAARGRGMPIKKMAEEAAFGPDEVARLSSAYEAALQLLHLTDRTDPVTEIVAKKIIEVALAGERDPPHICARALKELGIPLPDTRLV
jgi:hypothetical protein